MKEIQYLDIILNGILKNESGFRNYLVRKQKEAETKNFVSEIEFLQKCSDVVSLIENNFQTKYLDKKRELHQTIDLLKNNKEPFEKELELTESFSLERFNISLSNITNGKYKDELWHNQIKLIGIGALVALVRY